MNNIYIVTLSVFLISLLANGWLINYLTKFNIIDFPNERSNHLIPTPRGGGIAIIVSLLIGAIAANLLNNDIIIVLSGAVLLSIVSFIDDKKGLPIIIRLICQIIAVIMIIATLPDNQHVFHDFFPLYFDRILAALSLLWFINCFNFMDGIDGITATQTTHIAASVIILSYFIALPPNDKSLCYLIIASSLGFLKWNWHKAKIFMGDVGSIPLGLILGWLLIKISADGRLISALIIPAYYIADSGFTLLKRLFEGKKIWQAHSEHFYQKAVRNGKSHSNVVIKIIIVNLFLLILAILSLKTPLISLFVTIFLISGFLYYLQRSKSYI
jgi:UDP-N-acetylmuramyl pentapeptide phosphotransferase/UDP-N-acetylglucosamine-1-phosphate transferase